MDLPRVVFFGRTGTDTLAFFNLDLAAWRGQLVLDRPGGPGSFTAIARAAGVESMAADPLDDLPVAELEQRCRDDVAFTMERLARSASLPLDFDLSRFRQRSWRPTGRRPCPAFPSRRPASIWCSAAICSSVTPRSPTADSANSPTSISTGIASPWPNCCG